jgi:3-methyladenine DNA glycosylase AlkD
MSSKATDVVARLKKLGDAKDAAFLQRFFKTGPGEYAAGDTFLGVRVPQSRAVAKEFRALPVAEAFTLLESPLHEARLTALFILVAHFKQGDEALRKQIYDGYLARARFVNNWDLVDSSAPYIVGMYLLDRPKSVLTKLAKSKLLWERRIAALGTFWFIRERRYDDAIRIAELLLHDEHDLIHKAVGWMLREIGNRDLAVLRAFLEAHAHEMPRTMLRYSIEKLPAAERKDWLGRRLS